MRLLMRLLVVAALLAVPLGLAVASQALADRPGAPSVPAEPVVIEEAGPPPPDPAQPEPAQPDQAAPDATEPPAGPAATAPPTQPPAPGPQVVDPAPIPLDDDGEDTDQDGADDD